MASWKSSPYQSDAGPCKIIWRCPLGGHHSTMPSLLKCVLMCSLGRLASGGGGKMIGPVAGEGP